MYTATSLEDISEMLNKLADQQGVCIPSLSTKKAQQEQRGHVRGLKMAASILKETVLMPPAAPEENVADYCIRKLAREPEDATLRELLVSQPCGQDCKKAIDAAADMIHHIKAAFGNDETADIIYDIKREAERIVECYWRG